MLYSLAETGLPSGVPVVAGGGDFPVSMLGFGIVGEGVTASEQFTDLLTETAVRPLPNVEIDQEDVAAMNIKFPPGFSRSLI